MPNVTGEQHQTRVENHLLVYMDHDVIKRLRNYEPLTQIEIAPLKALVEIREEDGKELLERDDHKKRMFIARSIFVAIGSLLTRLIYTDISQFKRIG